MFVPFLSCLSGSEAIDLALIVRLYFLSCLSGSEGQRYE